MPPKKGKKGEGQQEKTKKSDSNDNYGRSKRKFVAKGEGMGGTIGLPMKDEKKCVLPCVKSFVKPSACCPSEMRCPIPICCTRLSDCQPTTCPGSTACCYMP